MFDRGIFMGWKRKTGAQARLIEISLALIVLLLGLYLIDNLNVLIISTRSYKALSSIANRILNILDENGVLYLIVYGENGEGAPELCKQIFKSILPSFYGYNFSVYEFKDNNLKILWSVSERFNMKNSASSSFIYLTFKGDEKIRVIILSISSEKE